MIPNGRRLKQNLANRMMNVVKMAELLSNSICQNPDFASGGVLYTWNYLSKITASIIILHENQLQLYATALVILKYSVQGMILSKAVLQQYGYIVKKSQIEVRNWLCLETPPSDMGIDVVSCIYCPLL